MGSAKQDGNCDGVAITDIGAFEVQFSSLPKNELPPTVTSVVADCRTHKITISFSGPVDAATGQALNYSVTGGSVSVKTAALGSNQRTVTLDTTGLAAGIPYTLTLGSMTHLCGTVRALNSQITFACPSEIRGRVFIDVNSSGCSFDSGTDLPLANWTVQLDGGAMNATTDANGEYYFTVTPGTCTINEVVQANWVQTCPVGSYNVLVGATQVVDQQNLANQATASVTDVAVDMVAVYPFGLTAPCCDVEMTYVISYVNKGTVAVNNATVQLTLLPGTSYQSSIANPLQLPPSGTNPYTWTLPTPLQPFAQGLIYVTVLVDSCGGNTPLLTAKADLLPYISGDANQSDNSTTHNVMVSCSFDPNDLQVSPKGCGFDGLVPRDTTFTYLILFQNLGSGPAHRVVVHDTLAAGLNLSTVNVLSSSHAYNLTANGQELVWTFSGIELPYADADEPGSHGFIRFQVRTLAGAVAGTQIPNVAEIYFDLNPAVVTSTTLNTLTNDPLPVASFSISATGNPFTRSFDYTGGTPGATLLWDFGVGASPAIAIGPSPQGVVRIFRTGTTNGLEIRIEPLGGQVKLTWDGGVLQESSTLPASWADVAMQESPWKFTPIAPKKFFRVRVP